MRARFLVLSLALLLSRVTAIPAQNPTDAAKVGAAAAKKIFGGGGMDAKDMANQLARGRLELKTPRFLPGSEMIQEGTEGDFVTLGEVLAGYQQQFVVYVTPESDKGVPPDPALAERRAQRAWARMIAAGVTDQKVSIGGALPDALRLGDKWPKLGEARIHLVRKGTP